MSQNAGKCLSHAELCRHIFGSLRQLSLCCFAAFYFVAPIWLLMPKGLKVGIGVNLLPCIAYFFVLSAKENLTAVTFPLQAIDNHFRPAHPLTRELLTLSATLPQ